MYSTSTCYTYDNNGNQIYSATETLTPAVAGQGASIEVSIVGEGESGGDSEVSFNEYDGFNRLIKVTSGSVTATYAYNGEGLRIGKTVNGVTTQHVWDGGQIMLELNGSGGVAQKYVRGINLIYGESGGTKQYYLFNGHGDVVQLTDASGTVTKNYDYDAFGNEKNADENDTNVFRYSGEYYDKETGTIYLRARYYDPTIGRFISEDSVRGEDKDPLSLNLYTYGNNNPVMYGDPSGHWVIDALFLAFDLYQLSQNWTPGNVTWVLFDVLTFGDPTGFLTITLHGAETLKAAKALEATGVLKPTLDAIEKGGVKFVESVGDMVRGANESKSSNIIRNELEGGLCFTGDTEIEIRGGHKQIKDIKVGDEVYSENIETGEKGFKEVKNLYIHETDVLIHIFINDEEVKATPAHPFWAMGKGWIEAGHLKIGDKLLLSSGQAVEISFISKESLNEPVLVYNFEVEDWHTYFVSDVGVLVHNSCSKIPLKAGDMTQNGYIYSIHGAQNANARGFTSGKIDGIISSYSQKVYQSGGKTVYAKKSGNYYDVVIVNNKKEIVTVVGGNTNSLKTWNDVTKMLNNNGGYSSLPMK